MFFKFLNNLFIYYISFPSLTLFPSPSLPRSFYLFDLIKTIAYFGAAHKIVTVQSHRVRHNCDFSHVPHKKWNEK